MKVLRIKYRHPITILKPASSDQNHTYKIGEDLVKINKKQSSFSRFQTKGLQVAGCRLQSGIQNLESGIRVVVQVKDGTETPAD